jgi:hypothetical protein
MSYSYTVPFNGTHSSIVIGKKGRCIKSLQEEFGVGIKAMKASPGTPLPYFLVEGEERQVHLAALKVFSLLSQSQARAEKHLRDDNAEMVTMLHDLDQENDDLKVAQFGPKSPIPHATTPTSATTKIGSEIIPWREGPVCGTCYSCSGNEAVWGFPSCREDTSTIEGWSRL